MTIEDYKTGRLLLFNKPLKWTSFGVVSKVRWLICNKYGIKKLKVGHAGTLDPLATGLLILCTGKMTKQIENYQAQEKEYIAEACFGATTPSYDAETEINEKFDYSHITEDTLKLALEKFIGDIEQIPPSYSAKYVDGKRAYKKARKGESFVLKSRKINISSIEIIKFELPYAKLKVVCGKGTYIRSLVFDIGTALNSGAYLSGLERTRIGDYSVKDAITIKEFENLIQEVEL